MSKRLIYEVHGQMGKPDGPWEYEAHVSKMGAAYATKRMADEGACLVRVEVSIPLPRSLSWEERRAATGDGPTHLGGHFNSVVAILNGQWRREGPKVLIELKEADDGEGLGNRVYSDVFEAKAVI